MIGRIMGGKTVAHLKKGLLQRLRITGRIRLRRSESVGPTTRRGQND